MDADQNFCVGINDLVQNMSMYGSENESEYDVDDVLVVGIDFGTT